MKPIVKFALCGLILGGSARVTLDGKRASLDADNTFLCHRVSRYTIRNTGVDPLVLLTVTTP